MTRILALHPTTKPAAEVVAGGDVCEIVGTTADRNARARRAVTVTLAASGRFYTADTGTGARDFATRGHALRWLKKVLAHESNDARFYE